MGCIYVAVSEAGVIKVGATKNPQGRLGGLKAGFRKFGDRLAQVEFCADIENYRGAEYRLITFMEKNANPHYGREWYEGSPFDQASKIAHETPEEFKRMRVYKPLSEKQLEKLMAQRKAEQDALEEKRRIELAAAAELRAERVRLRAIRNAQIAAVAISNLPQAA